MATGKAVRRWVLMVATCEAANWAQTTGKLRQNLAVPYMASPSKNRSHWSGRMGQATAVANEKCMATRACAATTVCMYTSDGKVEVEKSDNVCNPAHASFDPCCKVIHDNDYHLYFVGGDDFSATFTRWNGRKQHDAGNPRHGFRNDVWRLRAQRRTWLGMYDMVDRTRYDHKMPKLWSLLRWELRAPGRIPASGETYEEFISCQKPLREFRSPPVDCQSKKWFTKKKCEKIGRASCRERV